MKMNMHQKIKVKKLNNYSTLGIHLGNAITLVQDQKQILKEALWNACREFDALIAETHLKSKQITVSN